MPSWFDNDLLREGILRFRLKEYDAARRFLTRAMEASDDMHTRSEANYYLARMTDDPVEKRKYLEEVLAVNMAHAEARRELALLDGRLKAGEIVNPDATPAFVDDSAETPAFVEEKAEEGGSVELPQPKTDRFTCPKCGARMVFAPDGVSLVCEHCQRNEKVAFQKAEIEKDFFVAMANGKGLRSAVPVKPFKCQGCGATFMLAPNEVSATCAYCGSVHVVALEQMRNLLEPDAIIPMAFDQKGASAHLVEWIEKNRIQPVGKIPQPRGLYLPVWTFDITGSIAWNGKVTREHQVVPVSGEKGVTSFNVPVPAAHNLALLLKESLGGYDFTCAQAFDLRFLAGWTAEIYERSMADASLDARQHIVVKLRKDVQAEYGQVTDLSYDTSTMSATAFKLVLIPAWVTQVITREQRGRVLINGQTGSVTSELRLRRYSGLFDRLLSN